MPLTLLRLTLACCALCCLVHADTSFTIPAYRQIVETESLEKRQTGNVSASLGRMLYWFGHFSVGDSPDLRLLIDTGSSDLILNPGEYKPSNYSTRFKGHQNFSITYEGVNRAGFGFETINGTLQRDLVTAGGLTVDSQAIGTVTNYTYIDAARLPYAYQGDGIIGFAGRDGSSFDPPARSWFHSLCFTKGITECRFALAFGTSGTGTTVIGKIASELIDGPLTKVPTLGRYSVRGDVVLDGELLFENQTLIMDVGTDNIQGPLAQTRKMFKKLGYPSVSKTGTTPYDPKFPTVNEVAFFPCDKPPTLGFAFPAKVDRAPGQDYRIFNVSTALGIWDVYDHGNNNCTSVLGGTNALTDPKTGATSWLVGQPFFAGHYIDFDITHGFISYGNLANPATAV